MVHGKLSSKSKYVARTYVVNSMEIKTERHDNYSKIPEGDYDYL